MSARHVRRGYRRWCAVVVACVVAAAACSLPKTDRSGRTRPTSTAAAGTLGRGVSAASIRVGFTYLDGEALAKVGVKIDHLRFYDAVIRALVDDLNRRGGIGGRKIEPVIVKYSPIGDAPQLAACTELTEDKAVFVVLGGFFGDNNRCVTEQHNTALIGGGPAAMNDANLAAATAPWASPSPRASRLVRAMVKLLRAKKKLAGRKVAVYGAQAANRPLMDAVLAELKALNITPVDVTLIDANSGDLNAASTQAKTAAQRMKAAGVDVVINTGQLLPLVEFDAAGFHPAFYTLGTQELAATAEQIPVSSFPEVGAVGPAAIRNLEFLSPSFQRCVAVFEKATGEKVLTLSKEAALGHSSGNIALQDVCSSLAIFEAGASRAGKVLNNDTLRRGIESIGDTELVQSTAASFRPGKLDGQDTFSLVRLDPNWTKSSGTDQFIAIGTPMLIRK